MQCIHQVITTTKLVWCRFWPQMCVRIMQRLMQRWRGLIVVVSPHNWEVASSKKKGWVAVQNIPKPIPYQHLQCHAPFPCSRLTASASATTKVQKSKRCFCLKHCWLRYVEMYHVYRSYNEILWGFISLITGHAGTSYPGGVTGSSAEALWALPTYQWHWPW